MDLKAFGERLHALRKQAGLSQERLVEALDELARYGPADDYRVVDATLLSRWENARSHAGRHWKPTRPYLLHLIHLFSDQLTAESAQNWAGEAGYQITQADLHGLGASTVDGTDKAGADTRSIQHNFQHNLPTPLTSFVGREQEVTTLIELLSDASARLVTIVGEGGVGKTRLALAAAHVVADRGLSPDGVWFVPLAGVAAHSTAGAGPNPVISALAQSLSFKFGVRDDPATQLARFLRIKSQLIVLDNCEHLIEEAVAVIDLLQHAPNVRVWATSRVSLNCQAEYVLSLSGLTTPLTLDDAQKDGTRLARVASMQLFIERASQRNRAVSNFDARALDDVARLCRLVEGSPLALELAANWVGHISIAEVVDTLRRHDLSLLTTDQRDVPARHRSMAAVFEASWQLLSPAHQLALARLSVFRGAFSREAALAVAGAGIADLAALVNQSLLGAIQSQTSGSTRYSVHELLREFAAAKLATLEAALPAQEHTAHRHAWFYLHLLSERQDMFYSDASPIAVAEIDATLDNVRAAWQWAVMQGELELIAEAWLALRHFYHVRGLYQEGEATFREAATHIQSLHASDPLTADLRTAQAFFLNQLQRYDHSLAVAKSVLADLPWQVASPAAARAKMEWGISLSLQGKHDEAIAMLIEMVKQAHALQMHAAEARGLHAMYRNFQAMGDFAQAHAVLEQSAALYRRVGYTLAEGFVREALGHVALRQELLSQARQHYQDALDIYERVEDRTRAIESRKHLGVIAMFMGEFGKAYTYFLNAYTHHADDRDPRLTANTLEFFGRLMGQLGGYERAFEYVHRALALNRQIGNQASAIETLCILGRLHLQNGDATSALASYQDALAAIEASGAHAYASAAWLGIGEVLTELQRLEEAQVALDTALRLQHEMRQTQTIPMTLIALARVAHAQGQRTQALASVAGVLSAVNQHDYEYAADLPSILWTCYQVLQANGNDRALPTLQSAYQLVQAQAASIEDDTLRQSFLSRVKVNREIAEAYRNNRPAATNDSAITTTSTGV